MRSYKNDRNVIQADSSLSKIPTFIRRLLLLPDNDFVQEPQGLQKLPTNWMLGLTSPLRECMHGLFSYLHKFDLSNALLLSSVELQTSTVEKEDMCSHFTLDPVTVRDLNIFRLTAISNDDAKSSTSKDQSSLYWLMNNCLSSVGKRTFRNWLIHPLKNHTDILKRQDMVAWIATVSDDLSSLLGKRSNSANSGNLLSSGEGWIRSIVAALKSRDCPDIERLLSSLQHGRISPRKLLQLLRFASSLTCLRSEVISTLQKEAPLLLHEMCSKYLIEVGSMLQHAASILEVINTTEASQNNISDVFIYGDNAIDLVEGNVENGDPQESTLIKKSVERVKLLMRMRTVEDRLESELKAIRVIVKNPLLQFKSLRTGPTSSIEGLIEIPVTSNLAVPEDWIETNCTKQLRRYHAPKESLLI